MEDVTEFRIGDFAIGKWPYDTGRGTKNFIVRIYKIKKGNIFGSFLRPIKTKQYEGFVYGYPQIRDREIIKFNQIQQVLPKPKIYSRSMFLFINVNKKDYKL